MVLSLPRVKLSGVVKTTVTDWNRTPILLNALGNVLPILASLARSSGETVTAPGPTYAITSGVLNALGGSAAGSYSTSAALSDANRPTLTIPTAAVTGTLTTPGQTKVYGTNDPALPGLTLAGVVNTTVTDWNGTPTLLNDTGKIGRASCREGGWTGETVRAPGPTDADKSRGRNEEDRRE